MKIIRRNLTRALLLLGAGVVAYYLLEAADRTLLSMLFWRQAPIPSEALPEVEPPGNLRKSTTASDRDGNGWLGRALEEIEATGSISAQVILAGWTQGKLVENRGEYHQSGSGAKQRFLLSLEGRLADRPAKLLHISDGRFLWTDVTSYPPGGEPDRSVTRIDLRRLRREARQQSEADVAPTWVRFGGLPLLLSALNESFDFGAGRRMQLRGGEVVALVGRWNARRLDELFVDPEEHDSTVAVPLRAPHHVVVALDRETLFPMLIEYRSRDDQLAATGLSDESLLRPSARPQLKIDFLRPVLDAPQPSERFVYNPPTEFAWSDRTDRELVIARARREREQLARSSSAPRR